MQRCFRSRMVLSTGLVAIAMAAPPLGCGSDESRPGGSSLDEDPVDDDDRERDAGRPQSDAGVPETDAGPDAPASPDARAPSPSPASAMCGDGVIDDETESCEGEDLDGLTCTRLGFLGGELTCDDDCQLDVSDCTGTEQCADGRDNDGDALRDCLDDDCETACATSCDTPIDVTDQLEEGQLVLEGNTSGHASELGSSCHLEEGGSELVYRLVPEQSGVVSARLSSTALLSVAIRDQCVPSGEPNQSDDAAELTCAPGERWAEVESTAGEPLFVVVSGRRAQDTGGFTLELIARAMRCGDGFRDTAEECDDGNTEDDDGCSASCELESSEQEPNDDIDSASPFDNPHYGFIGSAEDTDVIEFDVEPNTSLVILSTRSVGDAACEDLRMDTVLDLLDEDGSLLASDDDGGEGYCSRLEVSFPPSGTYFARVSGLSGSEPETFPYRLVLATSVCGDGAVGAGEQCDDGNLSAGDGCSVSCRRE